MEEQNNMFGLLDMMVQPVFCVKENRIIRSNTAAQQLFFREGDDIRPLLEHGPEEYASFSGGCLYLSLSIAGQQINASVRRIDGLDIFELDTENESLRSLALAASQLRKPLSGALSQTAQLLDSQADPETLQQLSQLNRSLYQILRVLGNMSDAEYVSSQCRLETTDVSSLFREVFEKAQTLVAHSSIHLSFDDLKETIYCLADRAQLERAVLNILSNAVKFTPEGGSVTASLVRRGRTLRLTVQDSGSGIAQEIMGNLFRRYMRQPGIEDSRFGLGLGIRMIHAAAVHHGGTLLVTQSDTGGTRIVLTMAIRQKEENRFGSPVFSVDYTGGFDHSLVELSDCLPPTLFDGSF